MTHLKDVLTSCVLQLSAGDALTFDEIQKLVANMIFGKIIVGHCLWNDLSGALVSSPFSLALHLSPPLALLYPLSPGVLTHGQFLGSPTSQSPLEMSASIGRLERLSASPMLSGFRLSCGIL